MTKLLTNKYQTIMTANASGVVAGNSPAMPKDTYVYAIGAESASATGTGTIIAKTPLVTGEAQRTILSKALTTTLAAVPYHLIQDAAGADISGEYNQTLVRKGEKLAYSGTGFTASGTVYVNLTVSDDPLPSSR